VPRLDAPRDPRRADARRVLRRHARGPPRRRDLDRRRHAARPGRQLPDALRPAARRREGRAGRPLEPRPLSAGRRRRRDRPRRDRPPVQGRHEHPQLVDLARALARRRTHVRRGRAARRRRSRRTRRRAEQADPARLGRLARGRVDRGLATVGRLLRPQSERHRRLDRDRADRGRARALRRQGTHPARALGVAAGPGPRALAHDRRPHPSQRLARRWADLVRRPSDRRPEQQQRPSTSRASPTAPSPSPAIPSRATGPPRTPLSLLFSRDDGATWPLRVDVETGPGEFSYPALVASGASGEGLALCYTWNRRRIAFVRIPKVSPLLDACRPEEPR
jgi:hypothetical protein